MAVKSQSGAAAAPVPGDVVRPASSPDLRGRARKFRDRSRRRFWRSVPVVVGLCLALALWIIARLAASSFPASWERRVSNALSTDELAVEIRGVSFSLPRMRLRVDSFAAYPRGVVRRAVVSVAGIDLRLKPASWRPGPDWIGEIRMEALELDADSLFSLDTGGGEEEFKLPDFPQIKVFIRRASGLGLEAHGLSFNVAAAFGALSIDGATVSMHGRGDRVQTLGGRVFLDRNLIEASVSGSIDFAKLTPALRALDCPSLAGELEKFDFPGEPPSISATLLRSPPRGVRSLRVSVESGPMRYNDVPLSGFSGLVRVGGGASWNRVDVKPLEIRRPEGTVTGSLAVDIDREVLSFDCVSSMDPLRFATMLGLVDSADAPDIDFEFPTDIRGAGAIDIGEATSSTAVDFSASIPGASVRGFRFSDISASGTLRGRVLDVPRISAGAMDGSLECSFRLDAGERAGEEKTVSATLDLRGVPHSRWSSLVGNEADARAGGTLDLAATFDGPLSELGADVPKRGRGTFNADIRETNIFRVPLFAGLTDILADFVPGVDFLVEQNEAHIRATIDEGRWNVSRLAVSGGAFSIDGSGTADADGSDLDLVVRVRLLNEKSWVGRRVRDLLRPLSGLFGLHATGSASSPRWTVSPFSKSSAK